VMLWTDATEAAARRAGDRDDVWGRMFRPGY